MTKKSWTNRDPKAKRENARYEHPIPSREYIIQTMEAYDAPIDSATLAKKLGVKTQRDKGSLVNRLKAMVRDGQIIRNRRRDYCLVDRIPVVTGQIIAHRDGFGFVRIPDQEEDVFLSPRQMRTVFHGDRVAIRVSGHDRRGRPEGRLVEVLERRTQEFAGRFIREGGIGFVIPENPRITHHLLIPKGKAKGAKSGQMVVAKLVQAPSAEHHALAEIIEVMGDVTKPGLETDMAIRTYGLPYLWPDEVTEQTASFSSRVPLKAKKDRLDLRKLPLVTIDGSDAKDFDDAVFAEPVNKKANSDYRLVVAIADVAHYVEVGSPLDEEAFTRGTSVYFPNRVIPMLPEELSNGLCSLKPQVDRLCLICDMHINVNGVVTKSSFAKAVMHSAARLTYNEVNELLWGEVTPSAKGTKLLPHLENLREVYRRLAKARHRRGSVELDIPQSRFEFDEFGKVAAVVRYPRNHAHRLIEECMVTANVEAAKFLKQKKIPALYRNHPQPDEERIERLMSFLASVGITMPRRERLTPKDLNQVSQAIAKRPDASALSVSVLRAMMQAVYEPNCEGHFGLALKHYAHFTSPIRRYPDLLVHRAIAHVLQGGAKKDYLYSANQMEEFGVQCSRTERRAEEASRDVEKWLKCEYMLEHVGEEFEGTIVSVAEFGLFVEISELLVDGLVHVTALGNDYYTFDRDRNQLVGRRSGDRFSLGMPVRIRVAGVSVEDRKIDFELIGTERKNRTHYRDKSGKSDKRSRKKGKGKRGKKGKKSGKSSATRSDGTKSDSTYSSKIGSNKKKPNKKKPNKKSSGKKKTSSANSSPQAKNSSANKKTVAKKKTGKKTKHKNNVRKKSSRRGTAGKVQS